MKSYVNLWYLAQFLAWEMFHANVEEIKTHISCWKAFVFENFVVYETVWENIVEPDRPHCSKMYALCMLND